MRKTTIYDCSVIEIAKHNNKNGNISFIENNREVPFQVKRVFYLYNVPDGESRGAHAHKDLKELIVAANGCFDITLDDGTYKETYSLNRPYHGLLVAPGIWRVINNFSLGSVCLVLASDEYSEDDYIRNYHKYLAYKR